MQSNGIFCKRVFSNTPNDEYFAKVFETDPRRRLLGTFNAFGVPRKLFNWFKEFLDGKTRVVKVNRAQSEAAAVVSGTPQGTVLGPLLSVVYINDNLDNVESECLLFADDIKIYRANTSKEDARSLQFDLNTLEEWSDEWLLRLHPDKCHVLTLGKKLAARC